MPLVSFLLTHSDIRQVDGMLSVLSIAFVLLHRFQKTSREQERAQSELEAARSMQEVMMPQQIGAMPGFAIEAVYIPAQEVGGDFFRLFPGADGSLCVWQLNLAQFGSLIWPTL